MHYLVVKYKFHWISVSVYTFSFIICKPIFLRQNLVYHIWCPLKLKACIAKMIVYKERYIIVSRKDERKSQATSKQ